MLAPLMMLIVSIVDRMCIVVLLSTRESFPDWDRLFPNVTRTQLKEAK